MVKKILSVVFWFAFLILAFFWISDYVRVSNEEQPKYCISNIAHSFDDGIVTECTGLGYKIYNYNRESLPKGYQFGTIFTKMEQ